ncbi:7-cyano-7-deazaguanine synthase QueC [Acidithrix sp. C25]|uniref:7-cyano-7-deazaguanine synthase QueC n=1 Tax=Acidithrix sp. C25 TaxID=1671482 RepID=UPI00191B93C1|nr:7-cyano-7-deazaguanine synthase QueC [Acidithrix sp. C25]CAG4927686.1 unnamed protein product [Acidithrix sp. C25]
MANCVVLLSGGLDSSTVAAFAMSQGFDVHALSFNYGQRHLVELDAARRVARELGLHSHVVCDIDLRVFGGSALTASIDVPHRQSGEAVDFGASKEIPVTYVPARNTIFLSFALALAETISASDIFIGANSIDYSGYPDCRPEYLAAFEAMANLATKASVEKGQKTTIHAPLLTLTKVGIIELGLSLGVDYSITHSCYDPVDFNKPCGSCDSCLIRMGAFESLGMVDPLF